MKNVPGRLRRLLAALLCLTLTAGCFAVSAAEDSPATPTDLVPEAEPFEQAETVDGIRLTVTAEAGVLAPDDRLVIFRAENPELERAAEEASGFERQENVLFRHTVIAFAFGEQSGPVTVRAEGLGLPELGRTWPDGEISAAVFRYDSTRRELRDRAEDAGAEIDLSGDSVTFGMTRSGVYDIVTIVLLPTAEEEEPEEPAEGPEEEIVLAPEAEEPAGETEEESGEPGATGEPAPEPEEDPAEEPGTAVPAGETWPWELKEQPEKNTAGDEPAEEDPVEAFVTRCYRLILGREPDGSGLKHWAKQLKERSSTAALVISGFLNSEEFTNQRRTSEELVGILYRTMLDRGPDPAGLRNWVDVIANGANMNQLINGFCESNEFTGLCEKYGIRSGKLQPGKKPGPVAYSELLIGFITRCYREALDREPDREGLYYWCMLLASRKKTPQEVASGFVFSDEMKAKNLDNEGFIRSLYRLYMGREAEAGGLKFWLEKMSGGRTREQVSEGFANSNEFAGIVASYGLGPYGSMDSIFTIMPGDTAVTVRNGVKLTTRISAELAPAGTELKWTSSDEKIFTVSRDGVLFGNYPGKATLTVTRTDGKKVAGLTVTVLANYRAVLFSESTFREGNVKRNKADVRLMKNMLATVTGPDGGSYAVWTFDDLTSAEVFEKLDQLLVAPSRDGDVSLFFFASHGDYRSTDPQLAGRLWCINRETWVELPSLAKTLTRVQGKVIVWLESCGPGAAIHDFNTAAAGSGTAEGGTEPTDDPEMAAAVIRTFSAADPGLKVYRAPDPDKPKEALLQGDGKFENLFLTEKFIVMTASGYLQSSYMVGHDKANLFPVWIQNGVGLKGDMPADVENGDGNGELTVDELFRYVYDHTLYKQTPQIYPKDCDYVLFLRK